MIGPWLEVHIPDGLAVCIFNAQTCIAYFVIISPFARIRVDIMQAIVSDGSLLVRSSILWQLLGLSVVIPSYALRSIAMVKVKVDDSSVREAMTNGSIIDADMHIVEPAKSGRKVGRAVVTGWTDANKGPLGQLIGEDGIDSIADTAQAALQSREGFRAQVEISLVEFWEWLARVILAVADWPYELFGVHGKLRLSRITHDLQFFHPFGTVHCGNRSMVEWNVADRLSDLKGS